ncbi:hypothetical protein GW764_03870 [Candidatus Parcubacteria bacterium]|nr:hypothetical protein [Candidatus Parcubacteria bacterium]
MKEKLNNLKGKILENKKKTIISVAMVILIVFLVNGIVKSNFINNQEASLSESDLVKDLIGQIEEQNQQDTSDDEEGQSENGSQQNNILSPEIIDGLAYFSMVRVPVLASPDLFDYEGKKTNVCNEEIVWVFAEIEPTRAPLAASIEKLLNYEKDFGFEPGNFLSTQQNLDLNEVVIENQIAKIYLEGEFSLEEECDLSRIYTQLEEVALQYNSVNGVQIYLNSELLR